MADPEKTYANTAEYHGIPELVVQATLYMAEDIVKTPREKVGLTTQARSTVEESQEPQEPLKGKILD